MDDYKDEIEQLRWEYLKVDVKSDEEMRAWFEATKHLTSTDLSKVMGRTILSIDRRKHRCGAWLQPGGGLPDTVKASVFTLPVPDDWDNYEWMSRAYATSRSIKQIAEATGQPRSYIDQRLKQLGVNRQFDRKMQHPYRNHPWLHKHYVVDKMGVKACAKEAGVSIRTIYSWMDEFGISIRSPIEARNRTNTIRLWSRKLRQKLLEQPCVRKCGHLDRGLIVRYRSHLKEVYWFDKKETRKRAFLITRDQSRLTNVPQVHEQYPVGFGPSPYPAHLIIDRESYNSSSAIEQRVAAHNFMIAQRAKKWQRPYWPEEVLRRDWERMRKQPPGKHLRAGEIVEYVIGSGSNPGIPLTTQFFDLPEILGMVWASPRKLYSALAYVLKRGRNRICTSSLIEHAMRQYGHRPHNPCVYVDIFRSMNVRGTVLDLYPAYGCRAMACALLGLRYLTLPDPESKFERAMADGLGQFIGLDWGHDDGGQVDVVVADGDFNPVDLRLAMAYADRTHRIIGYSTAGNIDQATALNPSTVLRITNKWRQPHNYLLLW